MTRVPRPVLGVVLDVDGVLTLLVSSDAVAFHREFARRGLESRI